MNDPVTIITTGRVTADLELKLSQNGKNTKYVAFGLAVNRGYGENTHPNFYNCIVYGEDAQRMIDAKVKKGSAIQIIGDQELVEFTRKDNTTGWMAKVQVMNWSYALTSRPKNSEENAAEPAGESIPDYEGGFPAYENCGPNGLPFN